MLQLVGALNAWQAESQLASAAQQAESEVSIEPMQTALLLECGLTAHLQHIPQVTFISSRHQHALHVLLKYVMAYNVAQHALLFPNKS